MEPTTEPAILLASASPRRSALLAQIGVPHTILASEVDETRLDGESPADYVLRLARAKAERGWLAQRRLPALGADTAVVLDDQVFGKPRDRDAARAMLGALGGRVHRVLTAVALAWHGGVASELSASEVTLRPLSVAEIDRYWQSGEPCDKAGAYAIQGRGALFVAWLSGSHSGVMGLPLFETARLLQRAAMDRP